MQMLNVIALEIGMEITVDNVKKIIMEATVLFIVIQKEHLHKMVRVVTVEVHAQCWTLEKRLNVLNVNVLVKLKFLTMVKLRHISPIMSHQLVV